MIQLTKIVWQDSTPSHMDNGRLIVTIYNFVTPGNYETSLFSLNLNTRRLTFSHVYKNMVSMNCVNPHVEAGVLVPITLLPGEPLYDIGLSEMLSYVRNHFNDTDAEVDKRKIENILLELRQFSYQQPMEV